MTFEKLNAEGVRTLVSWAQAEGWNPGEHDADVFYATDPDGFYGCYADGELVAGGSVVAYGKQFGFMGLFIVRPEYRRNGIGRGLWFQRRNLLLSRLDRGAAIGMDGVINMKSFYEKGGFREAFREQRYQVLGRACDVDANVTAIKPEHHSQVLAYDRYCFGFDRRAFMQQWLTQPEALTLQYRKAGEVVGLAVMRKAVVGYKVGPLFADSMAIAGALYAACLHAAIGENVTMDVPLTNHQAKALVEEYAAVPVFECARMYYGSAPPLPLHKVYGITTLELG